MSLFGPFRFLTANGDVGGARSVLVVQSGAPEVLVQAVDMLRGALPPVRMSVLLQRNMRGRLPLSDGVEYLDNEGSKRALLKELRRRQFDAAFVLYTNHPGFWKLKLLPFMIGVPRVYAINEHMGWFPITLRSAAPLLRHLAWRAGSARSGFNAAIDLAQSAAHSAATPAIAAWLYAYEKIASARASLGKGVRWKDERRPR